MERRSDRERRTQYDKPPAGYDVNGRPQRRNLGELFGRLASDVQMLVHQEVQLAKTELSEKASSIGEQAGLVVGGGLTAYAGFLVSLMGVGFLLATLMPEWLAFLIVGIVALLGGAAMLNAGMSAIQSTGPGLDKTAESLAETAQWAKEEASDVKHDPAHLGSHK